MIEEPPILTIQRIFPRPGADDVAALEGVPTGFIVDAQDGRGAFDHDIMPLAGGDRLLGAFAGVALTCHCGPADNLALLAAVATATAGDVLVAATDRFEKTCVTGDLLMGMAKNNGIHALVTDGLVRDVEGILAVGLPVFCRGVTPNSPVSNGPGTVGLPVTMGGVTVAPGDVVVGDRDGAVVVAREKLPEVLARLERVKAAEEAMDPQVRGGLDVPERIRSLLQSDRVRYLD